MREMKKLSECAAPVNFLVFAILGFIPLYVLFRPSLGEYFLMIGIDVLMILLVRPYEGKIMQALYPETRLYFDGVKDEEVGQLSFSSKIALLDSVFKFPKARARYAFFASFVKVIPTIIVVVFVWEHEISNWLQFWSFMGVLCINFSYFYGLVFIEAHRYLSKWIKKLHEEFDWSDVFREVNIPQLRSEFEFQGILSLGAISIMMLVLQWFVISNGHYSGPLDLAVKMNLIGLFAIIVGGHLVVLARNFLAGGVKDLFNSLDQLDYKNSRSVLPLHSTEILARFEKSYNLLIERLKSSEQEVAAWAFNEAEKSRYRTIGEISALIAHDLNGPMSTAKFCLDELREDKEKIHDPEYLDQMTSNVNQAIELVESLRARLKNPKNKTTEVEFLEAHQQVVRLLRTQYYSEGFDRIQFILDDRLKVASLKLSRVDLIHILDNLYRNSVVNLLENNVSEPRISVHLEEAYSGQATILIKDNGSGLDKDQFEKMTDFHFAKNRLDSGKVNSSGLGLKLTRRLIELNGGDLRVLSTEQKGGTVFQLKLKETLSEDGSFI